MLQRACKPLMFQGKIWPMKRERFGIVRLAFVAVFVIGLSAPIFSVQPTDAAAITVTITADEDSHPAAGAGCSLREAIIAANTDSAYGGCPAGSGDDVIQLGSGTYILDDYTDITLSDNTSLQGLSEESTTIHSQEESYISIEDLTSGAYLRDLTFSDITINASGSDYTVQDVSVIGDAKLTIGGSGTVSHRVTAEGYGLVHFDGTDFFIEDIRGSDNAEIMVRGGQGTVQSVSMTGGALVLAAVSANMTVEARDIALSEASMYTRAGTGRLVVENALIQNSPNDGIFSEGWSSSGNVGETVLRNITVEEGDGIGIYHENDSTEQHRLYIENAIVRGNAGSGLYNNECQPGATTMYVTNSHILDNSTQSRGGGIYNLCGHVVLDRVTISGNHAAEHGGGIYNQSNASVDMVNTIIYGNTADIAGGGIAYNVSADNPVPMTYRNSTIARNTAPDGAGLFGDNEHTPLLVNVLFAENAGDQCSLATPFNPASTNNMSSDDSCGASFVVHDTLMIDEALADNGGSGAIGYQGQAGNIPTLALLSGSPAINAGTNTDCPSVDARDVSRPLLGTCDVGAYEFGVASTEQTVLAPTGGSARAIRIAAAIVAAASIMFGTYVLWRYRLQKYSAR